MKFRIGIGELTLPDPELVLLFEKGSTKVVQALLDALPHGMILSDLTGTVRVINSSACALFSTTKKEAFGRSITSLIQQSEMASEGLKNALVTGKRHDATWRSTNGTEILINARPVGGSDYNRLGSLVVLHDLDLIHYQARSRAPVDSATTVRISDRGTGRKQLQVQRRLSPLLDEVLKHGERAINRSARILLAGETGSGKTEIARTLHSLCFAENCPFVHVNCGGIPESLFESEMFGYEKGAFTGALKKGKAGHIESANNGILFLDEVGEMPLAVQSKLLTIFEKNRVQRVGSSKSIDVNIRLISASNQPLLQMVKEGRFRMDLYYRLAVITLVVPPLRDQPGLLPNLIDNILAKINLNRTPKLILSDELYSWLLSYPYPGNIRELVNMLEVLAVTADDLAEVSHLTKAAAWAECGEEVTQPLRPINPAGEAGYLPKDQGNTNLKSSVMAFEERVISEAIRKHGSKRKAANALGVNVSTIIRKMTRSCR